MRFVVVAGAGLLLAGCVQQPYAPPPPIQLQAYPPSIGYQTGPVYRPPTPAPLAEPYLPITPLGPPLIAEPAAPEGSSTEPLSPQTGPIPLQDMPTPRTDQPASSDAGSPASPVQARTEPAPAAPRVPTSGPGSNVPLEGFRPMRGQTRVTP